MKNIDKWVHHISYMLIFLTGMVYIYFKDFKEKPNEYALISHPLQHTFLKAHIIMSFVFLMILGYFYAIHIRKKVFKAKVKSKKSGYLYLFEMLILIVSACLLQISANEYNLNLAAKVHVWIGMASFFTLLSHVVSSRSQKNKAHEK